MFRMAKDEELTLDLLGEFIEAHKQEVRTRYQPLLNAYMSDHEILHLPRKAAYKPDNRIAVNFPKYIVDTMTGFGVGKPIKTVVKDNDEAADYVEHVEKYNDIDNHNAAMFTNCGIFGNCFEMYFLDEESEQRIACATPIDAFMIYDDSIIKRSLYFVRLYTDRNDIEYGSVSNAYGVRYFTVTGGLRWDDNGESGKDLKNGWKAHYYKGVPAVEFIGNEIRQGLFEPVMTQINAYNKAISEKANDVDYFADAYLKALGFKVDEEDLKFIRDSRVINVYGTDGEEVKVEFMDKPSNDEAQENLLDRLERHIFQIAMVANISDENFGGSSGTALQYRTLNMANLFEDKKSKFISGLNKRYKLLFSNPAAKAPADSWLKLEFVFTPNLPKNMLEESQIAAQLEGIVSHETQLKALSIVDNVKDELEKIEKETEAGKESAIDNKLLGFTAAVDQQAEGAVNE